MKRIHCPEVKSIDALSVGLEGSKKMKLKLLSEDAVCIELEPGGHTPDHKHDDKERLVVIAGNGTVKLGEELTDIEKDDFLEFQANEHHQIMNASNEILTIMCFRNQR